MRRLLTAGLIAGLCITPVAAFADPAADIANAFIKTGAASSYHISVATARGTMEMDVVKPNKQHMAMGDKMELIHISDDTWVKMNGSWMKMPSMAGMQGRMSAMAHDYAADYAAKKRDDIKVTDLGMQSVDGESLHGYEVTASDGTSSSTVYLGSDGYPRKIVPKSKDGSALRYSRFNDPTIKVEAPN